MTTLASPNSAPVSASLSRMPSATPCRSAAASQSVDAAWPHLIGPVPENPVDLFGCPIAGPAVDARAIGGNPQAVTKDMTAAKTAKTATAAKTAATATTAKTADDVHPSAVSAPPRSRRRSQTLLERDVLHAICDAYDYCRQMLSPGNVADTVDEPLEVIYPVLLDFRRRGLIIWRSSPGGVLLQPVRESIWF